ncbi:MAG: signal peptidase I [Spirochaetota bacterium]
MVPRSSRQYETHRELESPIRKIGRVIRFLVLLFLVYEGITTLLFSTVRQETIAMEPTLSTGDRLITLPPVYGPRIRLFNWVLPGFRAPSRGDLVTLRPGFAERPGIARRLFGPLYRFFTLDNRPTDDEDEWNNALQIKRIVGLPGDTVRMERFVAYVRPAGEREFASEFALAGGFYEIIAEDRPVDWRPLDPFGPAMEDFELGDDEYFVLADNRSTATDSRHWGPIGPEAITASVSIRFWPFSRLGRP